MIEHFDVIEQLAGQTDRLSDWVTLHRELVAYRVLVGHDFEDTNSSWDELEAASKLLETKRDALVEAEGFKNLYSHESNDDDWRFPDMGESFGSDVLTVSFQNSTCGTTTARAIGWWTTTKRCPNPVAGYPGAALLTRLRARVSPPRTLGTPPGRRPMAHPPSTSERGGAGRLGRPQPARRP